MYEIGPLVAVASDPLGLVERETVVAEPFELLVHPRIELVSDRPLTRQSDFARWAGHEAKIELVNANEAGRKKFKGMLLGLDGNDVMLEADGARFKFPFRGIAEAKLVLTDKLIAEDLKARKAQ